jgi:hypothetical protein
MYRPAALAPLALTLAAALALPMTANARIERSLDPVYSAASQYTATLSPKADLWRLTPLDGNDVEIRSGAACPHSTVPSKGLWLVGRDSQGRAELVAVSATLLPAEHSGRIALRACDDPALRVGSEPAYGVPSPVLDLLIAESGAVLVDD